MECLKNMKINDSLTKSAMQLNNSLIERQEERRTPKKTPGAKTVKKNTNSTHKKSQTHRAKQYEVTPFLNTACELSTETCSKNVYSLGPWQRDMEAG